MSAWRDRMLHATSDLADLKLLFLLAIVFVYIYYSLDEFFFFISKCLPQNNHGFSALVDFETVAFNLKKA